MTTYEVTLTWTADGSAVEDPPETWDWARLLFYDPTTEIQVEVREVPDLGEIDATEMEDALHRLIRMKRRGWLNRGALQGVITMEQADALYALFDAELTEQVARERSGT